MLVLLGGAAVLSVSLAARWQTILSDEQAYQAARAELVGQAVESLLRTQELVLDVIGRELLRREEGLLDASRQIPLLDSILEVDPILRGFGLARPDGQLVRVSTNLDLDRLPNLLTHPATRQSFLQALDSPAMVVGRTYYVEAMDAWAIPIRKALRTETDEVKAVMTAGLRLGSGATVFDQVLHDGDSDGVILYRENDGYVQFMSREGVGPEQYSQVFRPESVRQQDRRLLEEQLGIPVEEVKARGRAVVLSTQRQGQSFVTAAQFIGRYGLWAISETSMAPLYRQFGAYLSGYLLVFVVLATVLFWLFRIIDGAERYRRAELLHLSRHDELTGLRNRPGLLDRLDELMAQGTAFSLVVVNIDNFKGINDRFGQESGDEVLAAFGRRLRSLVAKTDDLARLGSDEFAVLTPSAEPSAVEHACRDLARELAETFQAGRLRLQLTASIGVAIYPGHADSPNKLIRSAHVALYEAKQSRNAVCVYRQDMDLEYLRRLQVEQRLRYGLAAGALHMVYQPQVDAEGTPVGLEALVRWHDEELGDVAPSEFVEVAEKSGLMVPLGDWVLETSMREYSELRRALGAALGLAINISVIQFRQPDFVARVMATLARYGVAPQELVLEITETLFMSSFAQVVEKLTQLRAEGIRISMDDFGTGYSSLSLLRKLPIDELKIDKSFVDNILDDEKAHNMIESIVAIATSHHMELVAEGVEQKGQAETLVRLGCRRFQGYYFGRPMSMAEFRERLLQPDGCDH